MFPFKIRNKTRIFSPAASFQEVLEILARVTGQEKKIEVIQIRKKGIKLSLFENDI